MNECYSHLISEESKEELAAQLKGSLYDFIRFFFKHVTKRDFIPSYPEGRESHHITVCRELTNVFRLETDTQRLIINVPPGHGKSLLLSMWCAWSYAHYPDSNFLYISYSHTLAAKHTSFVKEIMMSPMYEYLFDVRLRKDSRAKDSFQTEVGGHMAAFGSAGAVTGRDAGLPGLDRFSGALIIDDPIKPDDGHSDVVSSKIVRNYEETLRQRVRGENVPIVYIGQRVSESDPAEFVLSGKDIRAWDSVILEALDEYDNVLCPNVISKEELMEMREKAPYVYYSQYQQKPVPAGGALYKPDDFCILDEEPEFLFTFCTGDTAETDKEINDATAFSFWGVYKLNDEQFGLHWIDCDEFRIEPKDLELYFRDFWRKAQLHKTPPLKFAIEQKSTGVTLISTLKSMRGISVLPISRTRASGSKSTRFIALQPYIASKFVSFTRGAKHIDMCITHMSKITANNTHAHDDICDTCSDAIYGVYIDKSIQPIDKFKTNRHNLNRNQALIQKLSRARYG